MSHANTQPQLFTEDGERTSSLTAVGHAVRGLSVRVLAWVVGGILGVVGAVTTIYDLYHHHHGIGPWLMAAAFAVFFIAALDMWRTERHKASDLSTKVDRLQGSVARLELRGDELERDRDHWRRMDSEARGFIQTHIVSQISGGNALVASTSAPPLVTMSGFDTHALRFPPQRKAEDPTPSSTPDLEDDT